jgi:hypothetical protein
VVSAVAGLQQPLELHVVFAVAGLQHSLDVEAFLSAADVIPRQNVEMWSTKHIISAEVWKMEHSQIEKQIIE